MRENSKKTHVHRTYRLRELTRALGACPVGQALVESTATIDELVDKINADPGCRHDGLWGTYAGMFEWLWYNVRFQLGKSVEDGFVAGSSLPRGDYNRRLFRTSRIIEYEVRTLSRDVETLMDRLGLYTDEVVEG